MSPSFEAYKVFYYVAKHRNFTLAAKVLLTSQPSVTRTIKGLEENLGCRLFVRSTRGVTLTPEGELLYRHVAAACEELFRGEAALNSELGMENGAVYLGATETAIHGFLLSCLESFHHQYPKIRLKIINASTPAVMHDLRERRIDLAIVTTPVEVDGSVKIHPIRPFQDMMVAGRDFTELRDRTWSLRELQSYPLIGLSADTATSRFYADLYARNGLTFAPDMELATADLLLPMLRRNLGIGFVPEEMAREAVRAGEVFAVSLRETIPPRQICMARGLHTPLSPAARNLLRLLRQRTEEGCLSPDAVLY